MGQIIKKKKQEKRSTNLGAVAPPGAEAEQWGWGTHEDSICYWSWYFLKLESEVLISQICFLTLGNIVSVNILSMITYSK